MSATVRVGWIRVRDIFIQGQFVKSREWKYPRDRDGEQKFLKIPELCKKPGYFCTLYKISYGSVKIFANPLENALINR